MSTPASKSEDLTGPSSFVELIQDSTALSKEQLETQIEAFQATTEDASSKDTIETRFRPPLLYKPPEYLNAVESRSPNINWWRRTLALTIAAGLLYIVLDYARSPWAPTGTRPLAQKSAEPAKQEVASLIVNEATPSPADQPVPLGVSLENANDLNFLLVSELPKGTTLSAGHSVGEYGWSLYATEIKDAVIRPPPHFIGVMQPNVSLIVGPGINIAERRPLRFEWVADKFPKIKPSGDAPAVANIQDETPSKANSGIQTISELSPKETAALLKRGNELVSSGDLAAARLVLRRAAEAGNARAAFVLAGTYNPITLKQLHVHGLTPDLAIARHWYEKANELGSPDALRELQTLTVRRN